MGINQFKLTLAEISNTKSLRVNTSFYDKKELANAQIAKLQKKYKLVRLAELTRSVTQGLQVSLEDSDAQGEIGILSIENIDDNSTFILPAKGFLPSIPENNVLKEGILVTPRVRDIGNVGQIRHNEKFVSTENVLNIELNDDRLVKYSLKADFIVIFLLLIGKNQLRLLRTGGEAGNINHWLVQETLIPLIPLETQEIIVSNVNAIYDQMREEREKILTLQNIIEETFVKYKIKASRIPMAMTYFSSSLAKIGYENQLRFGALYRWFWDVKGGKLFDLVKSEFKPVPLSSLVVESPKQTEHQGILTQDYCLIELDDIESLTSRVINERLVDEINSDKVIFGKCDLLTSRLRPYLGYTILNDKSKPHIGTTELVPLNVKETVSPEFVRYLLLSDEYLLTSTYLMYGKEHPRIQIEDVLRIEVPNVPRLLQEIIVKEIKANENKNNAKQDKINSLKKMVETFVLEKLGLNS